jgi:glycosyltransferase involved in cell wall biosynthesis
MEVELLTVYNIQHDEVPDYISAADTVLLTSLFEGSPNVIKEAMACNRPIVSTRVGDVEDVIGNTAGCYLSDFIKEDLALCIEKAFDFSEEHKHTNGRERIKKQGLDINSTAEKLLKNYEAILNKQP